MAAPHGRGRRPGTDGAPARAIHLVVDAVAVRLGSVTVVLEHLLRGWSEEFPDDTVTVLFDPSVGETFALPAGYRAASPGAGRGRLGALWLRSGGVRAAARRLGADAVLEGVPASGLFGTAARRGVILYDLRFELRPEQFSARTRAARRVSWGWSMRRADRIFTISDRTLDDLARRHPRLATRAETAHLGSDHALAWPRPERGDDTRGRHAIAFGHFGNKNADAVIDGWASFCPHHPGWTLRLVGMGAADRAAAQEQVDRLGIADRVELMPWLDDDAFARTFAGADLVVFPSDFEGFGLPAAEALRLGIATVVSSDPALVEVTGGHAVVARSTSAADLAAAMEQALALDEEALARGRAFAEAFTWRATAATIRAGLT